MTLSVYISYLADSDQLKAEQLAERLSLSIDNNATNQLQVINSHIQLKIGSFLPLQADFRYQSWQKRHNQEKKQGLIRACKPKRGLRILDATAGWGRDAALLASFGAQVTMLERNPIMAALLQDALIRQEQIDKDLLSLTLHAVDAIQFIEALSVEDEPDIIYLDPMHPPREKSSLVKKDLQILQQLIGPDLDAHQLLQLARKKANKVIVKWPQNATALALPNSSITGKTVRYDVFLRIK